MSRRAAREAEARPEVARRYLRPRHLVAWRALALGLLLGMGGGLFYAWGVSPVVEFGTEPWQLSDADKMQYIVAIMLSYSYDSDLTRVIERLQSLRIEGDPIQAVANAACELATTGYVENNTGLRAVRAMMTFYRLQGRTGCADTLISAADAEPTTVVEVVMPTPTLVPPPSKTPTPEGPERPTPTPLQIVVPTSVPQNDFVLANVATFCDAELSGLIEVYVQDDAGEGIAGMEARVRWDDGQDTFFTGLKPERGPGYADFAMQPNTGYIVELPGRSDPISEPLTAASCTTEGGDRAVTSYRVVFRPG